MYGRTVKPVTLVRTAAVIRVGIGTTLAIAPGAFCEECCAMRNPAVRSSCSRAPSASETHCSALAVSSPLWSPAELVRLADGFSSGWQTK